MSRFHCKVVEAIPDRIVIYHEPQQLCILFYTIRGVPKQIQISLELIKRYSDEYCFECWHSDIKNVITKLIKKHNG